MRLHILSDLHLEKALKKNPSTGAFGQPIDYSKIRNLKPDVLILAGDIAPFDFFDSLIDLIKDYLKNTNVKHVIHVCGNHEYYCSKDNPTTLLKIRQRYDEEKIPGVHFLEKSYVDLKIKGVEYRFVGQTLWSLVGNDKQAVKIINDYNYILVDDPSPGSLTKMVNIKPQDIRSLHFDCVKYLSSQIEVDEPHPRIIVISHHLPSFKSIDTRYSFNQCNSSFASNLDHLFKPEVKLWIHGHTHSSLDYVADPKKPGKSTRVVCNPRGYPYPNNTFENDKFDLYLIVEVN